jgi:hypothetical protein
MQAALRHEHREDDGDGDQADAARNPAMSARCAARPQPMEGSEMPGYKVGYFVGSLSSRSITAVAQQSLRSVLSFRPRLRDREPLG